MRRIVPLLFALCLAATLALPAHAERRVALVIGNGAYPTAPLKNPTNDARDMAASLKGLGFEVILRENAGLRQMEDALDEFWGSLRKGGTGLFFFAGHGLQVKGVNYLVPVDARISVEQDVKSLCLDANRVLGRMDNAGNGLNIMLLDACRNNPFARSWRSADSGLAKMDAPTGTLIGYATAPDSVAADGAGRNGVYTQHLLREMRVPGQTIENAMKKVRIGVLNDTARKQTPWESSSLTGDFYFAGGTQTASLGPAASPAYTPAPPPKISAPPKPGSGTVDLSDIDADAAARARAEAEQARLDASARKGWAARLKAMQGDFAKVQAVEKSGKYSAEHKAKAWEKLLAVYSDKNPYSDEDQTLRAKAQAQRGYWDSVARRDQVEAELAAKQRDREKQLQQLALAPSPKQPPNAGAPLQAPVGAPGQTWTDPTTGMEFVWVPGGTFEMGCGSGETGCFDDEKPAHTVRISDLWVGKYAVTNAEYRKFKPDHDSGSRGGFLGIGSNTLNDDRQPVVEVASYEADQYAMWLSGKGNGKFRLLTEAEWEYAARAGTTTSRFWGDNPDDACKHANVHDQTGKRTNSEYKWVAHNCDDGYAVTAPVGSFRPNAFGLYDMLGNVWQWCEDAYNKDAYASHSLDNPKYSKGTLNRVYRGGGWPNEPRGVRAANRNSGAPGYRGGALGFRLVRIPD